MGKNIGWKIFAGFMVLALGASITYSAVPAVKEWTDGVIERITTKPSEDVSEDLSEEDSEEPSSEVPSEEPSEEPVLLEQYQLVFNKEQSFYINLNGPGINGLMNFNVFDFGNIEKLVVNGETLTYVFSEIDTVQDYYLKYVQLNEDTIYSSNFNFTEPILPFGIYDFSEIVITEEDQVLNPVYTPVYQ